MYMYHRLLSECHEDGVRDRNDHHTKHNTWKLKYVRSGTYGLLEEVIVYYIYYEQGFGFCNFIPETVPCCRPSQQPRDTCPQDQF